MNYVFINISLRMMESLRFIILHKANCAIHTTDQRVFRLHILRKKRYAKTYAGVLKYYYYMLVEFDYMCSSPTISGSVNMRNTGLVTSLFADIQSPARAGPSAGTISFTKLDIISFHSFCADWSFVIRFVDQEHHQNRPTNFKYSLVITALWDLKRTEQIITGDSVSPFVKLRLWYLTHWPLGDVIAISLHWRHNGRDCVSNHQPHDCLLNRLFRLGSKKTSNLRVTGLCVGNSPGPVNSPHKWPVTRKMFPLDDVIVSKQGTRNTCYGLSSWAFLWNCYQKNIIPLMISQLWSGDGSVQSGNPSLPEPMLTQISSPYGVTGPQRVKDERQILHICLQLQIENEEGNHVLFIVINTTLNFPGTKIKWLLVENIAYCIKGMINQYNLVKWRRWQVTQSGGGAHSRKVQQCQCCHLDGYPVRIKLCPVPITSLPHSTVQVVLVMAVMVTLAVVAGSTSGSEVISDRYRYRPSFQTCIQYNHHYAEIILGLRALYADHGSSYPGRSVNGDWRLIRHGL